MKIPSLLSSHYSFLSLFLLLFWFWFSVFWWYLKSFFFVAISFGGGIFLHMAVHSQCKFCHLWCNTYKIWHFWHQSGSWKWKQGCPGDLAEITKIRPVYIVLAKLLACSMCGGSGEDCRGMISSGDTYFISSVSGCCHGLLQSHKSRCRRPCLNSAQSHGHTSHVMVVLERVCAFLDWKWWAM